MTVHDVSACAVQPEAEQEPEQHTPPKEDKVAQMSSSVNAIDLNDSNESTASHFSHGLPQAQTQTSRFEHVFAQSQVRSTQSILQLRPIS